MTEPEHPRPAQERQRVHVLADGGEEKGVPAAPFQPLGHDAEGPLVHLVGAPVHVGHL